MTLFYLRAICLVLWVVAAGVLAPGTLRFVRGTFRSCDQYHAAFFFTALLFIGSIGRWLFIPQADGVFVALYGLTAALAVYVTILAVQERK